MDHRLDRVANNMMDNRSLFGSDSEGVDPLLALGLEDADMAPILLAYRLVAHQADVGLVHQHGGLKRLAGRLPR